MTRTVLITGGGTGIGRATAAAFAAEGDTVVITGRRAEPLQDTTADLEANLISAVVTTAAVRDRLAAGDAVITIGSIAAEKGAGSYGAKAAVATWNIELAAELGPSGITTNVVSPGYIADTEFFRDRLTDERRDALITATSTGRAGTPADIAGTVIFLASPAARRITGQVLPVNGGERTTR